MMAREEHKSTWESVKYRKFDSQFLPGYQNNYTAIRKDWNKNMQTKVVFGI